MHHRPLQEMSNTITIYEPRTAPIRGMASAKVASMIPPGSGVFSLIQNMRWGDTGVLTVKSGTVVMKDTGGTPIQIMSGATVRGYATVTMNGQLQHCFTSFKYADSGGNKTSVFWTTNHSTYTDITPSTGKHGDTRLGCDTSGNDYETSFQAVTDRYTGRDCLIIQNGFDNPRVWDISSQRTAIHRTITPPTRSNNWGATLEWRSYFVVNSHLNITYSSAPSNFSLADSDGVNVGNNAIRLHQATGAPSGIAYADISAAINNNGSLATQLDATDCRQLILVIRPVSGEIAVSHFLQNFQIWIRANGNDHLLVDPSQTFKDAVVVPADLSTRTYVIACSLDDVPDADLPHVTRVQLEAISGAVAPAAAYDLDILCIAASGQIPGNVSYAISYYNSDARSESYEQVLATKTRQIETMGSKNLAHLAIPDSELLYYQAQVRFQNSTAAEMQRGTDYVRVYRKQLSTNIENSEQDYTHVFQVDFARYNDPNPTGGWQFTQGTQALYLRSSHDNVAPGDRTLWLTSPGSFQQPIPISRCMAFTGNRLLCGARSDSQDAFPRVCASGASMPFRFSSLPFDPDNLAAPFEQEITGENLQAFATFSTSSLGMNAVLVFTSQSVWTLNLMAVGTPNLLSRELSVGTSSPFSISERHGRIYFVDTDRQVRLLADDNYVMQDPTGLMPATGEMPAPLSRGIVDDILKSIPTSRTRSIKGIWYADRYYLFYTPNGGTTNTQCLVFSEHANAWESNDLFPTGSELPSPMSIEGAIAWRPATATYAIFGEPRLHVLSADGYIYRLEVPGVAFQPGAAWANADIPIALNTGELHEAMWSGLHVKGLGLLADDQNARSLTGTVSYKPTGGSSSFTLSLDTPTNPYQWTIQRTQSAAANGIAAAVSFAGNVKGETKFYALKMEVEPREMLAPNAS